MIWRALITSAIATVALAAASSDAVAGTYDVIACGDAAGAANNSWLPSNNAPSKLETGGGCGQGGSYGGLFARDVLAVSNAAAGAEAYWLFAAPVGTSVTALSYSRWLFKDADDDWEPALKADGAVLETCAIRYPAVSCSGGTHGGQRRSATIANASSLTFGVRCAAPVSVTCGNGGTYHAAVAVLYGATVTLSDSSAPSVSNVSGSLFGGGYQTGTRSATFDGTDNVGIRSARIYVDDQAKAATTYPCDFSYAIPCQNRTGAALSLDTRAVADGLHTVRVAVTDPAGNETRSAARTITVDNTAPAAPQELTLETDGWQSANSFSVRWSNPAGQTAPIAAVRYRVCPLDGGPCSSDQRVARAGATRLDDISVASTGEWRLQVWLEDAAGNVDSTQTSSVVLRHGTAPAAAPEPAATPGAAPAPATNMPADDASPAAAAPQPTPVIVGPLTTPMPVALARTSPRLRITSTRYARGRLVIRGRTAPTASGRLALRFRAAGRTRRVIRAAPGGRFRIVVALRHPPTRILVGFPRTLAYEQQRISARVR